MNKRYVLKKQHNILKLLTKKQTVGTKSYVVYFKNECENIKIAISASKKVGNSVERNYEKRVCREIVSQRIKDLENIHMLIVIKNEATKLQFNEKEAQINYLINKIIKKKQMKGEINESKQNQ
jgi:ribonuclease P protein component